MNIRPDASLHRHPLPPWTLRETLILVGLLLAAVVLFATTAHAQVPLPRRRPSRPPSPVASPFTAIVWRQLYRTNLRADITGLIESPLDLPTVACRIEVHAARPGSGEGASGATWFLPAIDTGCGGDSSRWAFVPVIPVPEFDGDGGRGPWVTMGTCDTFMFTVWIENDLPGTGGKLWATRLVTKCWEGFELRAVTPERRRAAGR